MHGERKAVQDRDGESFNGLRLPQGWRNKKFHRTEHLTTQKNRATTARQDTTVYGERTSARTDQR